MMLKVAPDATSVAIVKDEQLLLFRSLEGLESGTPTAERMADDIYPSLVYFQDNHGAKVEELLVNGISGLDGFASALKEQTGIEVRELIGSSIASGNLRHDFAGAIGALL